MSVRSWIPPAAIVVTLLLLGACSTKRQLTESAARPVVAVPPPAHSLSTESIIVPAKPLRHAPPLGTVDVKGHFEDAFDKLAAMLRGDISPDFERAVFISENPYNGNRFAYADFQRDIDLGLYLIRRLMAANDRGDSINFNVRVGTNGRFRMADMRHLPAERRELYGKALANWAIFKYLTDTIYAALPNDSDSLGIYYHAPFSYAAHDPFGIKDWTNAQMIHLLRSEGRQGNCYTLTALYKILADRLGADARLCTAPQHIYIQHRDPKGDYYNVELATAGHPGDGTIQTLTHTTTEAIRSGIALRPYDARQSIGLCMVNLAKSYEHRFGTRDDGFMLRCAETVLRHDSLNLNALLLKQQVLETRVMAYAKERRVLDTDSLKAEREISRTVRELERHLALLYRLGYRQMPYDMQEIIMTGVYPDEFEDRNPSPFTSIDPKDGHRKRYQALYGGLFPEVFETRELEPYGHFTFRTPTNTIAALDTSARTGFLIDPVAFAYDFGARMYDARLGIFTSIDPLAHKFPQWSPYSAFAGNPIFFIDPDGRAVKPSTTQARDAIQSKLDQFNSHETLRQIFSGVTYGQIGTLNSPGTPQHGQAVNAFSLTGVSYGAARTLLEKDNSLSVEQKLEALAWVRALSALDVAEVAVYDNSNTTHVNMGTTPDGTVSDNTFVTSSRSVMEPFMRALSSAGDDIEQRDAAIGDLIRRAVGTNGIPFVSNDPGSDGSVTSIRSPSNQTLTIRGLYPVSGSDMNGVSNAVGNFGVKQGAISVRDLNTRHVLNEDQSITPSSR